MTSVSKNVTSIADHPVSNEQFLFQLQQIALLFVDNLRISSTSFLSVFNVLRMYYACSTQDFCNAGGTLGLSAFVKMSKKSGY